MKRLLIGLFILLFSVDGFSVLSYSGFTHIKKGLIVPGTPTGVLSFTVVSDGTDTLSTMTIKSSSLDFHTDSNDKIKDIDLYLDNGDNVFNESSDTLISSTKSDITTTPVDSVTLTLNESITTTTKTMLLVLTLGDNASITASSEIGMPSATGAPTITSRNINVAGVEVEFTSLADSNLVYDADVEKFRFLELKVTADVQEDFLIGDITVSNSQNNFDVTGSNNGVSALYLYKESGVGVGFSKDDDTLLKSITNKSGDPVTFNLTNLATFSFTAADNDNRKLIKNTPTTFYIVGDIGPSTNIEVANEAIKVSASVSSFTGQGDLSGYEYGPSVSTASNNSRTFTLAGMVIKSIENIFPSMNVAAGVQDVPILKFVAKSVGVKTRIKSLVISNDSNTFDANSNQQGITNLSLIMENACDGTKVKNVDNCLGEYSGYGDDGHDPDGGGPNPASPIIDKKLEKLDNTFEINDSSKATFTYQAGWNEDLDIAAGKERAFYVLADFGANMSVGQTVSLNISSDSRVAGDKDVDSDVTNDVGYQSLKIGTALPLTVTPSQDITVVDAALVVKTDFDNQTDTPNKGLFCATDNDGNCSNGGGATKKLVAGMHDILVYIMDIDVASQLTNASFQFGSAGFFSENSRGISKISMYLDKNVNGELDSNDVFLSSTNTFDSTSSATVTGVNLPQGTGQKLLVLIDLGQRLIDANDVLSLQLTGVSVDGGTAAAMVPNPPVPYTYDVEDHFLKIESLVTGISDSNVITEDSSFDVTVVVEGKNGKNVQLVGNNNVPLSRPKFYLDGVSGKDRSYEFTSTFNSNLSTSAGTLLTSFPSAAQRKITHSITASNVTSQGNYLIDYDILYRVDDADFLASDILLTRSKGAGTDFQSAVELSNITEAEKKKGITPSISTSNKVYSWSLPQYISAAEVQVNNQFIAFQNYQSVPQNSKLKLAFINNGQDIDPKSITVELNGTALLSESSVTSPLTDNYFTYDATQGELTIQSLGASSGQLTISANDLFGQAYPSAPIIFFTSSNLQIEKFLVYPNPFSPSLQPNGLTIGFSLTQPATVSFKIFDATGRELTRLEPTAFDMGYRTQSWNALITSTSKSLGSGTYYLKMTAVGDDGKKVVSTTKLAVY